ncbi:sorting nexin-2-like isoform X7 [Branchiostoma lanceolatum]|uniref:sorting nexin-2-like isoform X7 n=1 Tax=Branchiostoma lanceolatum TaxID=7740 RepID=UPI003451A203
MADDREPPPLFDDEKPDKKEDEDDLFATPNEAPKEEIKDEPASLPTEPAQDKASEDLFAADDDLFGAQNMQEDSAEPPKLEVVDDPPPEMDISGEGEEVDLDSPETEGPSSPAKMEPDSDSSPLEAPPMAEVLPPAKPVIEEKPKPTPAPRKPSMEKSKEEIEEEESGDQFALDIKVHDPGKIGDGMGAYMSYKVTTQCLDFGEEKKTSIPAFRRPSMTVTRRFSDFLGLHEKLSQKHTHIGRIVPPAPEKSVVGMTKIKMSKEDTSSTEFVEKRRALLERFLQRISLHPVLQMDPDFRDFLEQDELPRATSTSAVSGAGVLRLIKGVGDTFSKVTIKMDESDQWFEEKQNQVEALDQQLKKLHASVEALVTYRKELGISTSAFAKSTAMLSNSEEHTALSRALSQLAEVEEKIELVHLEQADNDFFLLSELLKDYIGIIQAIRVVFHERVKSFHNWQNAQQNLAKKREQEAKFKQTGKTDKIAQAQEEIREWEGKVEKGREDFEEISKTIRTEIRRFETNRVKDFRNIIIKYMETLMNSQQQLIKYWEGFLPEAKAIA